MNRESFWSGGFVFVLSIVLLVWVIPTYGGVGATFGMPPQLLPSIAAWIMLVCAGVVTIRGAIGMVRSKDLWIVSIPWRSVWGGIWPFLYVAACIVILDNNVPITYAGPFIIGIMLILLGERRWAMIIGCSLVPPFLLYLLSTYLMRIGIV